MADETEFQKLKDDLHDLIDACENDYRKLEQKIAGFFAAQKTSGTMPHDGPPNDGIVDTNAEVQTNADISPDTVTTPTQSTPNTLSQQDPVTGTGTTAVPPTTTAIDPVTGQPVTTTTTLGAETAPNAPIA